MERIRCISLESGFEPLRRVGRESVFLSPVLLTLVRKKGIIIGVKWFIRRNVMFDKIKGFFGFDEDENQVSDDFQDFESEEEVKTQEKRPREKSEKKNDKIVNINATTQLEVVLVKPEAYADGSIVADHLINRRTVVLNLESTNKEVSRRLLDFLSGVAYAIDGQIKRVANSTFIITPYNVGVVGDILDELENSGVYF